MQQPGRQQSLLELRYSVKMTTPLTKRRCVTYLPPTLIPSCSQFKCSNVLNVSINMLVNSFEDRLTPYLIIYKYTKLNDVGINNFDIRCKSAGRGWVQEVQRYLISLQTYTNYNRETGRLIYDEICYVLPIDKQRVTCRVTEERFDQ